MATTLSRSNHKIKVFIDDDSLIVREHLVTMFDELAGVEIVGQAENVAESIRAIQNLRPDVVILDIEMPEYSGFELLGFFREVDFEFIFVTAYENYARKAFEVSAVDYLLKPIEPDLLVAAVKKAIENRKFANMNHRLDILKDAFRGNEVTKIALPMNDGLLFVEVSEIMFIAAEGAYTHLFLKSGSKVTLSKNLRFFEELLEERPLFYRPHRSHLVNLNFIRKYLRGEGTLVMDNAYNISISRDKKIEFEQKLRALKLTL